MTQAGNKNGSGSERIVLCSLVPWILGTNSPKYEDLFLCIKTIIRLKLLLLRIIYKKNNFNSFSHFTFALIALK